MEDRDEGEVEPDEREDSEEPAEEGGLLEYEYSSDRREPAKRRVRSSTVGAYSASRSWREA